MGHILTCYQLMKMQLPYLYNSQPYSTITCTKTIFLYKWQRMSMEQATLTVECCPIFDDSFTGEYYSAYINWIIIINAYNLYEHTDNSLLHFGQ